MVTFGHTSTPTTSNTHNSKLWWWSFFTWEWIINTTIMALTTIHNPVYKQPFVRSLFSCWLFPKPFLTFWKKYVSDHKIRNFTWNCHQTLISSYLVCCNVYTNITKSLPHPFLGLFHLTSIFEGNWTSHYLNTKGNACAVAPCFLFWIGQVCGMLHYYY